MASAWDLFTAGFLPAFQQSGADYRADQRHGEEMQFRQQGFDLQKSAFEQEQAAAELAALQEADRLAAFELAAANLPPEMQAAAAANPDLLTTYYEQQMAPKKPVVVGDALIDPTTGRPIYEAPDDPFETFMQVRGSDLGLAGPDAERIYNVSNKTGKVAAIGGGGVTVNTGTKVPAGYRLAPDGESVVPIKGGPKDPSVLANKSDTELKSLGFADRAEASDSILNDLGQPGGGETAQTIVGEMLGGAAGMFSDTAGQATESAILPAEGQQRDQAQRDFVTAVLRKESGAVINESEFRTEARKFFPQPGDDKKTVEQKAAARARAIDNLKREGGIEPTGDVAETTNGAQERVSPGGIKYKVRTSL